MDLHLSHPPLGTLERAPATALRPRTPEIDAANEQWEGFWCVADDRYYARCTRSNGTVVWYSIRDTACDALAGPRVRVLPYRRPLTTVVFVSRKDRSAVIVGASRRRSRPRRGGRS